MAGPETPKKAGSSESPKKNGAEPTSAEAYFFMYILKHCKTKPDVDWEAVAQDAGFKNASVALTRYGQIRRKHGFAAGGTSPAKAAASPAAGKKTAGGRVAKKTVTPRKGKGKAAAAATADEEDDDEDLNGGVEKKEDGEEELGIKNELLEDFKC